MYPQCNTNQLCALAIYVEAAVAIQLSRHAENVSSTLVQQLEDMLTEIFCMWGLDERVSREWSKTISQSTRLAVGQYEESMKKELEAEKERIAANPGGGAQPGREGTIAAQLEEEEEDKYGGRTTIEVRPVSRSRAGLDRRGTPAPTLNGAENPEALSASTTGTVTHGLTLRRAFSNDR